jgi:import inner membrane translocase subunit TIM54
VSAPAKEPPPSGIALVGRNTLKEYLWALKKGYLDEIDLEREQRIAESDVEAVETAELAAELDKDGLFPNFTPTDLPRDSRFLPQTASLPPQPPILLLPFSHPLGSMLFWPLKLTTWLFGERNRVKTGGDAAFALIVGQTREIQPPSSAHGPGIYDEETEAARVWLTDEGKMAIPKGNDVFRSRCTGSVDLDVDLKSERYITSVRSFSSKDES